MIEVNIDVCAAECMRSKRSPKILANGHVGQRIEREKSDISSFKRMRFERTTRCSAMKHERVKRDAGEASLQAVVDSEQLHNFAIDARFFADFFHGNFSG